MAFFSHMLTESVDLEPLDSLGDDGSRSWGSKSTDLAARVDQSTSVSGGGEGAEEDVRDVVWLEAEEVKEGDRIHLPDGEVLEVQKVTVTKTTDGRLSIYKARG